MAAPTRVGRYEIVRELGRGAMGVVYLAHDPKIDRQVAIKTIQKNPALSEQESEESRQRFLREAQAAGKLIHSGIVTIFDVGEDQGLSYIAMEYVEGQTLEAWTKPERLLPVEKALLMVCQASHALDYAHHHHIVHRDIKPANLMVVGEKVLKIMDFGLAKNPAANLTSAGTLIGTPNYMSPEQIMGKPLDGRSDLFSLGVVLYELLTGERPFGGDTISTIIYRILHEVPRTPETVNPNLPPALSRIILKTLEKDPAKRYPSGDEFAAALHEHLESIGALPGSVALRARGTKPAPAVLPAAADRAGPAARPAPPSATKGAAPEAAGRAAARPASAPKRRSVALPVALVVLAAAAASAYVFRQDLMGLARIASGSITPGDANASTDPNAHDSSRPIVLPPVEPPTPLPQGEVVSIRVETDPPGGRVLLDDREVTGGTVVLGESDTMSHTLVGMNECREGRLAIRAGGGIGTAMIRLDTLRLERVRVDSSPQGAAIVLDGRDMRMQTPADVTLTACEHHTITARLAGYKDGAREFGAKTAWANVSPIRFTLEKLPDGFVLVKAPYPIEIFEGSRAVGSSGEPVRLPAGRHVLKLVNTDLFVEITEDVEVPPEGTVNPKTDFPPTGQLTVLANPGDGTVYINGRRVGPLPFIGHNLAEGTYTLKYALDSGRSEERTILVIAGQSKTEKFILN